MPSCGTPSLVKSSSVPAPRLHSHSCAQLKKGTQPWWVESHQMTTSIQGTLSIAQQSGPSPLRATPAHISLSAQPLQCLFIFTLSCRPGFFSLHEFHLPPCSLYGFSQAALSELFLLPWAPDPSLFLCCPLEQDYSVHIHTRLIFFVDPTHLNQTFPPLLGGSYSCQRLPSLTDWHHLN